MPTCCMLAKHPDTSGVDGLKNYLETLRYPLYVSPKIDGCRALVSKLGVRTRDAKPIPNPHVRRLLKSLPVGFDGEVVCAGSFTETSGTFRHTGRVPSAIRYYVFDMVKTGWTFQQRKSELESLFETNANPNEVILVPHHLCTRIEDVLHYYRNYTEMGYPFGEGICLRDPDAKYKIGRSTQQELIAVKGYEFYEALVIGTEELLHRQSPNESTGLPMNRLGALVCKSKSFTSEFTIGTGFTIEQRNALWKERDTLVGRTVRFRSMSVGAEDAPRQPVFKELL